MYLKYTDIPDLNGLSTIEIKSVVRAWRRSHRSPIAGAILIFVFLTHFTREWLQTHLGSGTGLLIILLCLAPIGWIAYLIELQLLAKTAKHFLPFKHFK